MTTRLDPDRWRRIGEVLDAALSCEPEHGPAVLDATCAGAPDLRREVEELLRRVDRARGFLESPPTAAAAAVLAEANEAQVSECGRRIGAYQIEHEIGHGGMSRVFLAHRADGQFEQLVALKLLRPGLDTEIDQARFRAERQILASLNHPNIARLLDGGLTDAGQPYLVLEYVDGQPIDAYCEANALSVRDRLQPLPGDRARPVADTATGGPPAACSALALAPSAIDCAPRRPSAPVDSPSACQRHRA